jgi:4,5-dihydroxyphthalate decarboxylase
VAPLLKQPDIEINRSGDSLSKLLADGEIDAVISSRPVEAIGSNPDIARLFPNYREVEKDYYRRTRIFPKERGALRYMLPWLPADMDEIDDVFGGDPWPYGVEANRPTLEALVQYMVEQHFIAQRIPIEELFVVGR